MAKAIAISLESPFGLAFTSLTNSIYAIIDFMYGTSERTRYTCAFAVGMVILGGLLNMAGVTPWACSHDMLAVH